MKIIVDSAMFAECMRKIQPAVGVSKENKQIIENSVQLTITKQQKIKEGYIGIAVAYDGKKQLFSAFLISELEMEEEKKDVCISGKRLCDISNALDNGNEVAMILEVDKTCLIKKGGNQIQIPLGEAPIVLYPGKDWILGTIVDTKELQNLLFKGGRFYDPAAEGSTSSVCFRFDLENGKLQISSTDIYKLALYGVDTKYEVSDQLKEEKRSEVVCQIEGEQIKHLGRFLSSKNTEIYLYEKYLYFKSGSDIAMFLIADSGDRPYALGAVLAMEEAHSRECKLQIMPKDVLEALTIFDVANQEDEPYVYVTREKNTGICFSTKGKTSKSLVPCKMEGEFKKTVLNSKILRQVIQNYEKDDEMIIHMGKAEEGILLKESEKVKNFNIISKISE